MCVDPATLTIVATIASAVVSGVGAIQQGNAQYAAGMYNAQIADRNAQAAENERVNVQDKAAIERRRLGERVRAEKGDLNAKFTAMGLDPAFGTPADLVGDVQQAYNVDRNILGRNEITDLGNLDKEAADYRDSASMARSGAKSARTAGFISAAGSLLQSAASVAPHWIQQPIATPSTITASPLSADTSAYVNANLQPYSTFQPLHVGG